MAFWKKNKEQNKGKQTKQSLEEKVETPFQKPERIEAKDLTPEEAQQINEDYQKLNEYYIEGNKEADVFSEISPQAIYFMQVKLYDILSNTTTSNAFNTAVERLTEFRQNNIKRDTFSELSPAEKKFISKLENIKFWISGSDGNIKEDLKEVKEFLEQYDIKKDYSDAYGIELATNRANNLLGQTTFNGKNIGSEGNLQTVKELINKIQKGYSVFGKEKLPLGIVYSIAPVFNEIGNTRMDELSRAYNIDPTTERKEQFEKANKILGTSFKKLTGKTVEQYQKELGSENQTGTVSTRLAFKDEKGNHKITDVQIDYHSKDMVLEAIAMELGTKKSSSTVYSLYEIEHKGVVFEEYSFPVFVESKEQEAINHEIYDNGMHVFADRESPYLQSPAVKKLVFETAETIRQEIEEGIYKPMQLNQNAIVNARKALDAEQNQQQGMQFNYTVKE